jgi:catalase
MGDADIAERIIDFVNAAYGSYPGYRAVHAKGVLCAAIFVPTTPAADLCRAAHFRGPPVRAHVRFSNASGDPSVNDGVTGGRGMAVKFYVDGSTTDILGSTSPTFVARTPEDFLTFNEARRPDPATGAPDPERVGAYLADHPEAMPAVEAALTQPVPASYATLAFHGLHAFGFESADGTTRFGRYHLVPAAGEVGLAAEDAATRAPDFLRDELTARFENEPVVFDLQIELAEDGDPLDDPTAVWPPGRDTVDAGRLEITGLAFDREQGDDILVFDPTRVIDGIALSPDPILLARRHIYGVSVARRTGS